MAITRLWGYDVSHWNEKLVTDNFLLCNPADFIIAKATEGYTYHDSRFDYYMALADRFGLLRGAYHYIKPDWGNRANLNPLWEAKNFVAHVRPYGDALLALDFEEKELFNSEGIDYLAKVALYVKEFTGTAPLIYASESVIVSHDFKALVELGCGLWVAKWSGSYGKSNIPSANRGQFSTTAIQQYTSKSLISDGKVVAPTSLDGDVAYMTDLAWAKYANPRL